MNWKDVVKELDQPGFIVRDRQALVLLVSGLRRALPTELYIDLLYGRWNNVEGQVRENSNSNEVIGRILVIMACSSYSLSRCILFW